MSKLSTKTKRVAFIDVYNLESSAKEFGNIVDYQNLFSWLNKRVGCELIYFYAGLEPGDEETEKHYQQIGDMGYETRIKRMTIFKNPPKKTAVRCPSCFHEWIERVDMGYRRKANCDVELTFDTMRLAQKFNEFIFFTGDGDFYELFEYLLQNKKLVTIVSRSYNKSRRMSIKFKKLFAIHKAKFIELDSLKYIVTKKEGLS